MRRLIACCDQCGTEGDMNVAAPDLLPNGWIRGYMVIRTEEDGMREMMPDLCCQTCLTAWVAANTQANAEPPA